MGLNTELCQFLGIEHPIMLAGMGGVSYSEMCAAMCNAGGYGVLGMAGTSPDFIAAQMADVKARTDKPFGVDLLAADPASLEKSVDVIIEGGGHTGLVGTLPLVAQAVEAVNIPVIAAGGIYDGRGLAAALSLGAVGVWMGTRFIASEEAHAAQSYKDTIIGASDIDTTRTRCYSGKPMRCRTNDYIKDWETRPGDIQTFPMQAMHSIQTDVIGGIGGVVDEARLDANKSCFAMGQSAGGVTEVLPVADIVDNIMREAEAAIEGVARLRV